jgi:enoyl-CoA hydratase/carnithine racemase
MAMRGWSRRSRRGSLAVSDAALAPSVVGRSRALEIVPSGDDFDADIADRYGWVNRTLDDDGLDAFIDTLIGRLTSFDREALAGVAQCAGAPCQGP